MKASLLICTRGGTPGRLVRGPALTSSRLFYTFVGAIQSDQPAGVQSKAILSSAREEPLPYVAAQHKCICDGRKEGPRAINR